MYKPNLFPNNSVTGIDIDWAARIIEPEKWLVSEKLDGIRLSIQFDDGKRCKIVSRSLKPFRSVWIQRLEQKLDGLIRGPIYIDAEVYCVGMRFNELQHFILTKDVTTRAAIKKTAHEHTKNGKFESRSVEWLTTYQHNFQVNLFDLYVPRNGGDPFWRRLGLLREIYLDMRSVISDTVQLVTQLRMDELGGILSYYEDVVDSTGEGLVIKHENHIYKCGRNTLKECTVFKMKDEMVWFHGIIIDVEEGTIVDPMVETSTNELGYSVTSKLKEDRMPSGMAKGFLVRSEHWEVTVTLKGFNNNEKALLLQNKREWFGRPIHFIGMYPTKINGAPRGAKYIKL